jgi:hypothetical protein
MLIPTGAGDGVRSFGGKGFPALELLEVLREVCADLVTFAAKARVDCRFAAAVERPGGIVVRVVRWLPER